MQERPLASLFQQTIQDVFRTPLRPSRHATVGDGDRLHCNAGDLVFPKQQRIGQLRNPGGLGFSHICLGIAKHHNVRTIPRPHERIILTQNLFEGLFHDLPDQRLGLRPARFAKLQLEFVHAKTDHLANVQIFRPALTGYR